jgi:tetratricopeptide (TPR) repeat protein
LSRDVKTWRHSSLKLCRSNILLWHPLSVPVLLVAVILVVYYPALLSGMHPIDDPGIFTFYSASPRLSNIVLPGYGYYYRPVVGLSFYIDNLLWGMAPGVMHLENILLHCANTLLIYLLAHRIPRDRESSLIPLLAALLFALHPVNVEAVAWIAGRTDPLLALFVLSATYFWIRWLEKPQQLDMIATLVLFGIALLTKETALAFGAVALLLALTWPGSATARQRFKAVGLLFLPGVLLVTFALLFRSATSGLSRFMAGTDLQVVQNAWEAMISLGFYIRKLVVPFPLNFAITAVHPMYGLLGVVLFPILWLLFRTYRLAGVFFTVSALYILPAILVAVTQIAWTPFAERYLYLPTAFLALGLVGINESWQRRNSVAVMSILALLLCGFAICSLQRNLLWKDPLAFFQDAVAKSPEFGSVYHSLGGLLFQKGEIDQAYEAFITADRLNQRVSMRDPIKLCIMGTMLAKGEYLEARNYFFQIFKKKEDAPADFLELLYKADSKRLETLDNGKKLLLAFNLLETLDLLNGKKPDPFWLYRSGQISLVAGNSSEAVEFFHRAYTAAPMDSHYKAAAKTYYLRLEARK